MNELYYVYNNEAIASCAIMEVLKVVRRIDLPRICLLLPFLLDDRIVSSLSRSDLPSQDLNSFVRQQPKIFSSFNRKYYALLPITINAILLLKKGGKIEIGKDIILKEELNIEDQEMGERLGKIIAIVPKLPVLFAGLNSAELYKTLKVQL